MLDWKLHATAEVGGLLTGRCDMQVSSVMRTPRPATPSRREPLVTLKEAAPRLGVTWEFLRKHSPPIQLSRQQTGRDCNYYRLSVLRKWVADLKVTP